MAVNLDFSLLLPILLVNVSMSYLTMQKSGVKFLLQLKIVQIYNPEIRQSVCYAFNMYNAPCCAINSSSNNLQLIRIHKFTHATSY